MVAGEGICSAVCGTSRRVSGGGVDEAKEDNTAARAPRPRLPISYVVNERIHVHYYLETHPGLSNQVNDPLLPATGLDVDVMSGLMWDGRVSIRMRATLTPGRQVANETAGTYALRTRGPCQGRESHMLLCILRGFAAHTPTLTHCWLVRHAARSRLQLLLNDAHPIVVVAGTSPLPLRAVHASSCPVEPQHEIVILSSSVASSQAPSNSLSRQYAAAARAAPLYVAWALTISVSCRCGKVLEYL